MLCAALLVTNVFSRVMAPLLAIAPPVPKLCAPPSKAALLLRAMRFSVTFAPSCTHTPAPVSATLHAHGEVTDRDSATAHLNHPIERAAIQDRIAWQLAFDDDRAINDEVLDVSALIDRDRATSGIVDGRLQQRVKLAQPSDSPYTCVRWG